MPAIRKDLNCAICKFKSSSIRTFNAHLRTNHLEETGSKPKSNFDKNSNGRICFKNLTIRLDGMKCHSCPFIATNDQLVSDHIRDEHQEEATSTPKKTPRRYKQNDKASKNTTNNCLACKKTFKNKRQLKFHTKSIHQVKPRKIFNFRVPGYMKCGFKKSDQKTNENNNLIVDNANYKCFICQDKFLSSKILTEHVKNVHVVVRPKPVSKLCMLKFVKFALNAGSKLNCARKLFK